MYLDPFRIRKYFTRWYFRWLYSYTLEIFRTWSCTDLTIWLVLVILFCLQTIIPYIKSIMFPFFFIIYFFFSLSLDLWIILLRQILFFIHTFIFFSALFMIGLYYNRASEQMSKEIKNDFLVCLRIKFCNA